MFNQLALRDRLIFIFVVLLAGIAGGLLSFYLLSNSLVNGVNYVEKVTEKQVYLENSAKIEAVSRVADSLITVVESAKVDEFLGLRSMDAESCFDVVNNCGANGIILTSDGLVLLSWNNLGKDYKNKDWTLLGNDSKQYDLVFLTEDDKTGLVLGKMVKKGEKTVADNLRSKLLGFKSLAFADDKLLSVGQEILLTKNNVWTSSVNVKSDLVVSLKNEKSFRDSNIIFDLDAGFKPVKVGTGVAGEGVLLADLGGQIVGFNTINSHGEWQLISATQIRSLLSKYEQGKSWDRISFGLKYSLNNKNKQTASGLPLDYGVIVEEINNDTVMAKNFGVRKGDLILEVDGQSLADHDFHELMDSKARGQKLVLTVIREGKKQDLKGSL